MISSQFTLFDKTIQRLGDSGILSDIILIGSWCLYFYRISFNNDEDIPILRTLDIDFLIKNPPDITRTVDLSQILKVIGFIEEFSLLQGFSKFMHPELEIEFLTPEHREMMKSLMSSLPVKWQKEIKAVIKENSDKIYEFYLEK